MIARILSLPFPLRVLVTTILLSAILAWIVWDRVNLLRTGTEIVLKTRPIDPRSLFRGHYVRLEYEVGRIKTDRVRVSGKFKRHDPVFVRLEPGPDGYWGAVSVQKTPPRKNTGLYLSGSVYRVGVVLEQDAQREELHRKLRACTTPLCRKTARTALAKLNKQPRRIKQCGTLACQSLQVHYGLERYFVPKHRARALEKKRDQQSLAVLVRVSPFGVGAISGLMIDGKKIYDEPLF